MITRSSSISTIQQTDGIVDTQKKNDASYRADVGMSVNYDPNQSFVTPALKNSVLALLRSGAGITQAFVRNDSASKPRPSNFAASSLSGEIEPLDWMYLAQNRILPGMPFLTYMTGFGASARYAKGGSYEDVNRAYNQGSRALKINYYDLATHTVKTAIVHRGNSQVTVYYRRDACIENNPRTGFLRLKYVGFSELYADGNYYEDQYGIRYLGMPDNSIQWPNNSPLPPGMRYKEAYDVVRQSDDSHNASADYDIMFREDVGQIIRPNIVPNGSLINYEYQKQDRSIMPNCLDDDTYWTGTVKEPLNWSDPQWELYVDKDKLALWLEEHPGAKIRSDS